MAGTRGLATFRTEQLREKLIRDYHFDTQFKINEDKVDIKWREHREILEDTKIDVFLQVNKKSTASMSFLDVTELLSYGIAVHEKSEGIVLNQRVALRKYGTEDSPVFDSAGEKVYGKLRHDTTDAANPKLYLDFYSIHNGSETTYTFTSDTENVIDFKVVLRTNLSVIPKDAIINAGSSFVEGATDAKAYLNLIQLMKDLYGPSGTLDNDGNANLSTSLAQQVANEAVERTNADKAIRDDLAAKAAGLGASLIGVVDDSNYKGLTVQQVLSNLAARLQSMEQGSGSEIEATHTRDSASGNGYFQEKTGGQAFSSIEDRLVDIESVVDGEFKRQAERLTQLETEDDRYAFEAAGGETKVILPSGKKAKTNSLFLTVNGALQAPGINYDEVAESGTGHIIGANFAPDTLKKDDVVFLWWKRP